MAYVYESIQPGVFNFSIPEQDKKVQLFLGQTVVVKNKLSGGLLRVLRLVKEIPDEPQEEIKKVATKQDAKVVDKITKVVEVVETPQENLVVSTDDSIVAVKEEDSVGETESTTTPENTNPASKRKPKRPNNK